MKGGSTKSRLKALEEKITALISVRRKKGGGLFQLSGENLERAYRDTFGFFYIGINEAGEEFPIQPKTAEELAELVCPFCKHQTEQCETRGIDKEHECSRFEPTPESWAN